MKSKRTILSETLWADQIHRIRGPIETRFNKIRLDKNEKPDYHLSEFLKKIRKNIRNEHLTAYPETEILYRTISKKFNTPLKKSLHKNVDLFTELWSVFIEI